MIDSFEKKDGFRLFALVFAVTLIFALISNALFKFAQSFFETEAGFWVLSLINQSVFVLTVFLYCKYQKKNFAQCLSFKKTSAKNIVLAVVMAVGLLAFMLPIQSRLIEWLISLGVNVGSSVPSAKDGWGLAAQLIFAALVPAFAEEVLSRGAIANSFKNLGVVKASLISGALFSVMHLSAAQTLHPFITGVVFALVMFATGSFWAAFAMHFANNVLVILLDYCVPNLQSFIISPNGWFLCLAGVGLICATLIPLFNNFKKTYRQPLKVAEKVQVTEIAVFAAAVIGCVFLWIVNL